MVKVQIPASHHPGDLMASKTASAFVLPTNGDWVVIQKCRKNCLVAFTVSVHTVKPPTKIPGKVATWPAEQALLFAFCGRARSASHARRG